MNLPTFQEFLDAGVHFGHQTKKWNPAMAPYIFMEKNGIHIIDLNKTVVKLEEASKAVKQITKSGKTILFVATKKQAKEIIASKLKETGMPYITERWWGGMLTNFATLRRALKKISNIEKLEKGGTFEKLSKREKLQLLREKEKLERRLGSVSEMSKLPSAIFVVDVLKEKIAIKEAQKLGIPIFAMVDTNSDPKGIDFVIPANDDAAQSIDLILKVIVQSIKEGLSERVIEKDKEKDEKKVKTPIRKKTDKYEELDNESEIDSDNNIDINDVE